jgi:hypothetical protein
MGPAKAPAGAHSGLKRSRGLRRSRATA